MKIAQLTPRFLPSRGGLENMVFETAKYLVKDGHKITVYTSNLVEKNTHLKGRSELIDGILIKRSSAFPLLPMQGGIVNVMPQMFFDVLRDKSDIYHSYGIGSFPTIMGALKHKFGNRVVLSAISDMRIGKLSQKMIDKLTMSIMKSADKIIVLTNEEKTYFLKNTELEENFIKVIPPGINLERFSKFTISPEQFRKKYNLHTNVIFYAGRIDNWHKGLDNLVKALPIIKKDFEISCVISGDDWGSKAPLESLAQKLGVYENLKFFDPRDQKFLGEAYSSADVFVLPSNFETFGMVLVEAMASGTPVIGSRVGGIVDVIDNGKTGFIVPPKDPQSLAEKIIEILGNRKLRETMSINAKKASTRYSSDIIGAKIIEIYKELLES